MPSTIPYDPSLTLGSIVPQDKLDNIINIGNYRRQRMPPKLT